MLTHLYHRALRPLAERWLGGIHTGLVVKSLYLQRVARRVLASGRKDVFDAGCGSEAQLLALLAGRYHGSSFEGWDLHLDKAVIEDRCVRRQLRNITVAETDLCTFNRKEQYDVIYSIDVLEHIEDYEGILDRLVTALRPGGRLWLHVPSLRQRLWFRAASHDDAHVYRPHRSGDDHVREGFEMEQLREVIERRGMTVTCLQRTFGPVTGWLKELYTLGERRRVKGIGIILLPFVVASVWWDHIFAPRRGNGVWVEATKTDEMKPG